MYDSLAAERAKWTQDQEKFQKERAAELEARDAQIKQLNDDYQRVLAALMTNAAPDGAAARGVPGRTARAGTQPAATVPAQEPEIDWYDPRQVFERYEKRLTEQNAAWAKYADEMNEYWKNFVGQAQGYSVAAARLMATDPEFAKDPKLVASLFTEAQRYGGDIDKAYQQLKAPIVERAKLQAELEALRKQVEDHKKQLPAMLGQLAPQGPRPIKPVLGSRPTWSGSTGRYNEILSRYHPSQFYTETEEQPTGESVNAF